MDYFKNFFILYNVLFSFFFLSLTFHYHYRFTDLLLTSDKIMHTISEPHLTRQLNAGPLQEIAQDSDRHKRPVCISLYLSLSFFFGATCPIDS